MATAIKLRSDIKKLKAAIASKATPKSFLPKLKGQLEKAENELDALSKGAKPRKTSTSKGTQSTLNALQKLIQKKKYSVYQGQGVDLKKDANEGALATGRRISKGLKANQFGDKKSNKGNVYYENRPNRLDVKQPKKAQKYPKLEKGGFPDMLKEDDVVWNAVGKKLVVDKVTDSEYFLSGFMQPSPSPFSKSKVHEYIKKGEWSLKPKMAKGGQVTGTFKFMPFKLEGNMHVSTRLKGVSPDNVMVKGLEGKLKGDDYNSAINVAQVILDEHDYIDMVKIIKVGATLLKSKTVAEIKRDSDDKSTFHVDYFEEGGVMSKGSTDKKYSDVKKDKIEKIKLQIDEVDKFLKNLEKENTKEAYEQSSNLRSYKAILEAKLLHLEDANEMADGGVIKWQDAQIGDSARVLSENKTGLIMQSYGRKFHLRFPDDSEKTYDAKELEFIKDEDDFFDNGGEVHVADHFKKGGETFSEKQLKELLDEALTYFYHGLNKLDVVNRYLEITGQGGMKTALSDKLNLAALKDSIEKIADYTS